MVEKTTAAEEAEYWRLQEMVSRLETMLNFGGNVDGTVTGMLLRGITGAKQQMARIEGDEEKRAVEEKETATRQREINLVLVARETALNEAEKREYGALLEHEYFTKNEFGQLGHFYRHSYDRLTDGGKAEMSHRVWEGVRHGQYRFNELPDPVKEKEAQQVQNGLQGAKSSAGDLSAIPESDKADFLRARKNGEREQSYQVLNRQSFAEHVDTTHAEPAHEPVASHEMGSKKNPLQDTQGLDGIAANLQPPLSDRAGVSAGKTR